MLMRWNKEALCPYFNAAVTSGLISMQIQHSSNNIDQILKPLETQSPCLSHSIPPCGVGCRMISGIFCITRSLGKIIYMVSEILQHGLYSFPNPCLHLSSFILYNQTWNVTTVNINEVQHKFHCFILQHRSWFSKPIIQKCSIITLSP